MIKLKDFLYSEKMKISSKELFARVQSRHPDLIVCFIQYDEESEGFMTHDYDEILDDFMKSIDQRVDLPIIEGIPFDNFYGINIREAPQEIWIIGPSFFQCYTFFVKEYFEEFTRRLRSKFISRNLNETPSR